RHLGTRARLQEMPRPSEDSVPATQEAAVVPALRGREAGGAGGGLRAAGGGEAAGGGGDWPRRGALTRPTRASRASRPRNAPGQTGASGPSGPRTAADERNSAIGIVLVLTSAVAWSTAGFFARMVPVDIWVVLSWRSAFGALSIVGLAFIERRRFAFDWRRAFVPAGIAMMILNGVGMAGLVFSLQNTHTAHRTITYPTPALTTPPSPS